MIAALLSACSGASKGNKDAGASETVTVERARSLLDPNRPLVDRPSAISTAQAVEALGVREGAGARATELHTLAAKLLERVWRIDGREQDAREAIDVYRGASHDLAAPGGCDAALRGARLSGELAHDASTTYAELYRVQRRMAAAQSAAGSDGSDASAAPVPGGPCSHEIEDALAMLAAFRPPARVLESIDEGLSGEGAVATSPVLEAGALPAAGAQIVRVESWPGKESARVVVVLDRPAAFRPGDATGIPGQPPRTFVDLDGVDVGKAPRDLRMAGIVGRVSSAGTTTGARVTLDLDGQAFRRVFYLPEPFRIVIDIARHPPGAAPTHGTRSVDRVVLDPGHGGSDPGAIGTSGVKEKEVTMDIAHRAAPILAKAGLQVVLTRDDDRLVTLEERTARANAFGADLFISIHCNAAENHTRHGVETYILDTTKDEIAARVAARENATSQAATAELGSILADLRLADQATHSTRLAELLQRAAMASLHDRYGDELDGGVKTAGFYVLVGARMPCVLFETSYMSNPIEEQRLGSEDYRQRLADAISNAVRAYREGR